MTKNTELAASALGLSRGEKLEIALVYLPIVVATVFGFIASAIIGNVSTGTSGIGSGHIHSWTAPRSGR